jgi:hypothetical protein
MEPEDKKLAEAVLKHLCQGAQIDGLRFGPVLQILITDHTSSKTPIRGQVYLNLGSSWTVFTTPPTSWPTNEDDQPEPSIDEQLRTICELRELVIADIKLAYTQPHLIMTLEDGRILFVNGWHEKYECWQLGVALGGSDEFWLVVATPNGGVAVWAPDSFEVPAEQP